LRSMAIAYAVVGTAWFAMWLHLPGARLLDAVDGVGTPLFWVRMYLVGPLVLGLVGLLGLRFRFWLYAALWANCVLWLFLSASELFESDPMQPSPVWVVAVFLLSLGTLVFLTADLRHRFRRSAAA
jgi:hypothetical protein